MATNKKNQPSKLSNKQNQPSKLSNKQWTDPRNLGISDRSFFKPEDGKTKRIKLLDIPTRARAQFIQGMGFVHTLCEYTNNNGVEIKVKDGIDVELTGKEPQVIWMAPVLVYNTDNKGQIGNRKVENVEYEFQLWTFYKDTYRRLFQLIAEWGEEAFSERDILITGVKRGLYLNTDIAVSAKTAICLHPTIRDRVEAEFATYEYRDIDRWIARTLNEEQMIEAIGKAKQTADDSQGNIKDGSK